MVADYRRIRWFLGFLALLASGSAALRADEPAPAANGKKTKHVFIRITRDANKDPLAMETAIVHYVPKDPALAGLSVDLIGAVHVGEKEYYKALNKKFEG